MKTIDFRHIDLPRCPTCGAGRTGRPADYVQCDRTEIADGEVIRVIAPDGTKTINRASVDHRPDEGIRWIRYQAV